jgi:magnesium-transporting ATPase (P-type)
MVRDLVLLDDWRRLVAANLNNDEEDCLVDDCDDRASHPLRGCQIDLSFLKNFAEPHLLKLPTMACCKKKSTESNRAAAVDYTIRFTEHQLTLAAFAAQFGTSRVDERDPWLSRGLTSDEAAEALARDGGNALSPPKSQSDWMLFLRQFTNWFMLLLLAAGVLGLVAFFLDTSVLINLYLTLILFLVVLVTCLLSFWQERKSAHVMASFHSMLPPDASVVRDGEPRLVPAAELVVGDVVRLTPGVKVPADLRLIAVRGLRVENASLTGESQPVQCAVECTDNAPLETRNLVFNSSLVITGDALGVVVRTGDRTVIGSIAKLATRTQQAQTTLQREVSHFVRVISVGAVVMGIVFFIVGVARGQPWLSVFVNGFLTILVANVPQGLPATVTSLLSLSAARLRKRNMWIKRLDSVETLGSVSLIASDKTGTLTKNELTVVDVWVGAETVHVAGNVTEALVRQPPPFPALLSMHRVVGMCNGAQATVLEDGERRAVGNPVDVALLAAFGARGTLQLRQEAEVVYERPFNSRAKNHVVVVKTGGGGDVAAEFESADSSSEGSAGARASTAKKAHKIKQLVVIANPSQFESHVKGAPEYCWRCRRTMSIATARAAPSTTSSARASRARTRCLPRPVAALSVFACASLTLLVRRSMPSTMTCRAPTTACYIRRCRARRTRLSASRRCRILRASASPTP